MQEHLLRWRMALERFAARNLGPYPSVLLVRLDDMQDRVKSPLADAVTLVHTLPPVSELV